MVTKIGVSTGVFYKYFEEDELDQMISSLKSIDVDIIEILYARPFMLDLPLSNENMNYLQAKEVLIHSPFFVDQGYEDLCYNKPLIEKLIEKKRLLKAKYIIIHPDLLPNFNLISNYPEIFVFENLKSERGYSIQRLLNLMKSGLSIKISLDIGHLNNIDAVELSKLIKKYKKNIAEIQLSIKEDYEDFLDGKIGSKYSFLIGIDIPIILETRPRELSHLGIIIKNLKNFVQDYNHPT